MEDEAYFKIRNWEKFQHYKKRNPPWIKLHNSLLRDYEFNKLKPELQLILLKLWLFCSTQNKNRINSNPDWIKSQLGLKRKVDLKPLFDAEFIEWCVEDASIELATCKQSADTETEHASTAEAETEAKASSIKQPSTETEKIVGLWNMISPNKTKGFFPKRTDLVIRYWQQMPDLLYWQTIFEKAAASKFLKTTKWKVTLEWAMEHHIEISEGKYDDQENNVRTKSSRLVE